MHRGQIMEYAPAEPLFENPLHPYTRLLLAALPDPESGKRSPAASFEAEPPRASSELPEGCGFRTKCPEADDRCRLFGGDLTMAGEEHYVRCWRT